MSIPPASAPSLPPASAPSPPRINTDKPFVIPSCLSNWEPLHWRPADWLDVLPSLVDVRVGLVQHELPHPQWERHTAIKRIATKDLFSQSDLHLSTATNDLLLPTPTKDLQLPTPTKDLHLPTPTNDLPLPSPNKDQHLPTWAYYDYKYLHQVMPDVCHKFPWDSCGFPGRDGRDSTLWVATKHAHTPCHKDTYGCNLVAQILGTKTWTLFPPEQGSLLLPTRVPYEESSVYSQIDLAHLDNVPEDQRKLLEKTTPYTFTLRPGQVLYVPRHWWHQVTSDTFSISVNTWIESQLDNSARVEEALVRYKVACQCKILEKEDLNCLLNPNEDDLVESDLSELSDLVLDVAQLEAKSETVNNDINLSIIQKLTHKIEELKPGRLSFESVPVTSISKEADKNHIKLLKVSTSEAVISEEAKALRNKIKYGQGF